MANGKLQETQAEFLLMSRDLQESKARLEEAQRVAHVGYWIWNLETDRVTWSDETYRIFGLTPQEGPIDLATVRELIHPEDRQAVFRTAEEAVRSGTRADCEHRLLRPNGEVRIVHSLGDLKKDSSGRPYQMFGTTQDITDRKRAEESLRQTQIYLREGQRLAHMGSWAFNDLGAYWSDELYQIFGLDPGKGAPTVEQYLAIIHPQDRASMAETIKMMFQQHCGCDVTKRFVRPDGQLRYVRCVANPVVEQGVFKGFRGTAMDVTEQELLTRELRRQQAYLAEAQSLTHTGSWACNLVTRQIFHSSDENARVYGFDPSRGAIPFERFYNSIHPEDEPALRAELESSIRTGADYDVEFRIRRPDGTVRFLRGIGHHNPSGEPGEYIGITMDITERKRAEEERERLRQLQADLAHVTRVTTMGELTASLAHEVNQPIAASVTNASACLRWLAAHPPDLEEARQALGRIIKDGNRAGEVIARIRALVKKSPPQQDRLDINETIREVILLTDAEVHRNRISLQTQLSNDLPPILGDRIQLQQVILNLIKNAIEAMSVVSDRPRGLLVSSGKDEPRGVLVAVRDSGPGFSPAALARLFDAFYTTKPEGMGMGLAISRSIIEAHGGRLWTTPNHPHGAVFQFTLPTDGGRMP